MAVTDEAIDQLKEMIISGRLQPGDRLPREADLAIELGVSRNSLREAVRALALVRVLDVRQGDGTYVTSLESALLMDALAFVVEFQRDSEVMHYLEVRRVLEPAAAAMAARRISATEAAELRRHAEQARPDLPVDELVLNDLEFHRRIAVIAGNPVLAALIESVTGPTTRARVWRGLTQEDAHRRTLAEHLGIVDALERHEPEIASARSLVHVSAVEDWLRQSL
jgi:DNA-binding FadR family transcriptional regulator